MKKELHELIHEAKLKAPTSENLINLRNYLNESYHEHEFLNMKNSFQRLIHNLEYLSNQENVDAKCFANILNAPNKFSSSLMSLCENILQLLTLEPKLRIQHQHHCSQVIFLALFLKFCQPDKYVTIVTTKASFKNWQKYLIDTKSTDPESDLKKLLQDVKIKTCFINQSYSESFSHSNQILIFDLMNTEIIEYRPLLLKHKQSLYVAEKIIFYHSHVDQIQVEKVLCEIEFECFVTEAAQTYPIQINFLQKDLEIKQKLTDFLKEDSNHPQKQDIIIFYKNEHLSNSTAKRYSQKLKIILTQNHLQNQVQFICDRNEIIHPGKNHIFIVQNCDQLAQWNYSYEDVLFVIDYGWSVSYRMDHNRNYFVEILGKACLRQRTRRLSFVGISKVGRYIYAEDQFSEIQTHLERATQLMSYTLRMVQLDLSEFLESENQRVKCCIEALKRNFIIKNDENNKLIIVDQEILKLNKLGVDPIQAKIINSCIQKQKEKQQKTVSNLILMALAVINIRSNLRQVRQNVGAHENIKPTGIWRKSGYLDSCIQILTKAQIIESGKNSKKSISKRSTSKVEEEYIDGFGSLFDFVEPTKIEFEDMKIEDLLKEYVVSDRVFAEMRHNLDELRELFEIEQTNIKFDQALLNEVVEILSQLVPNSVAIFSGSRRLGYRFKNEVMTKSSIFLNRECLMAQLNETPQFVIVLRCTQNQGKRQIFMCNTIQVDSFMSTFGQLPSKNSESLAQHQIQFHGISSSIFKGLFRNNSLEMQKFEEQFKCFIEPNEEMATITIYCSKEHGSKIKQAFESLIGKIKQKFVNYNKIIHYLGNTNISMSNGGQIKEIIKSNYINKCQLHNLDLQVTQQDLQDLVEGFFVLKSIEILPVEMGKFSKTAIIEFNSQKDYYRFFSYYNEIKYYDRMLEVKPIAMDKSNTIEAQMFVDFKWYVWKSHHKAIVIFKKKQSAEEALKALQQNSLVDGNPVQFQGKQNKITFNNLHETIDQIFLEKAFMIYGQIQAVQILKTPLKQPTHQQRLIDYIIKDTLGIPQKDEVDDKYKINAIQKHKSGLRSCRVIVKKAEHLTALAEKLNSVKGKIGQSRLYAESLFTKPILILYPSAVLIYEELLNEVMTKDPQKPNVHYKLKDYGSKRIYLILSSPFSGALNYVVAELEKKLKPIEVKLTSLQKNIILSEVGISNLIDLEEKFNCKIVVNSQKKTLQVICKRALLSKITQQINGRVEDKFFYRISLNTRSYKSLLKDKAKLEEIQKKYFLTLLQIQEYSKTLIFEGSANHVQNALNYMMHLIESFSKSEDELINTQVCLICYEQPTRPYRLQNCGHKFCFGCLDQCINSILGDITMFPIKCPHCMVELTIDDLQSLIETGSWPKLINMGVTQYVNKNAQQMSFCYTPGCKQINLLKLNSFKCDLCAASFCTECKQHLHEGLTCDQAKDNVDALFKKYMEENDVRVCPNNNCKMPIVRTDGCFRVTCSRCNKSMCFKCPADKMIAYDDYNECYKHLNDAHGGYW